MLLFTDSFPRYRSMLTFASLYGEGQLKKYGASVYARMGMASAVLVLLQVTFSTRPLRARAYEVSCRRPACLSPAAVC